MNLNNVRLFASMAFKAVLVFSLPKMVLLIHMKETKR